MGWQLFGAQHSQQNLTPRERFSKLNIDLRRVAE